MTICPMCGNEITNWAAATWKVVTVNGIKYHLKCAGNFKISELGNGVKFVPQKDP